MSTRMGVLVLIVLSSPRPAWASPPGAVPGTETAAMAAGAGYLRQWQPAPPARSAPAWARPGLVSFARWDGGPLETCKALLSGWPNFNPPVPDYLYAMTNWYDTSTVRFLQQSSINTIWVTFSNGFSIDTETPQRELLRRYIAECHRRGIHVMAYESAANLFCEDMYQHVPESRHWASIGKDGKPVPYGAADYSGLGRVTRHMADMDHPGWREYVKQRIDLAVEAQADGVMYDNVLAPHMADFLADMMSYALGRKKDFLMMANFHARHYIFNRLLNAVTTEDGGEAGVFTAENLQRPVARVAGREVPNHWLAQCGTMLPVEGGYLANNIGRFRVFENLSEGWKPAMIESNLRERGNRMTDVISAPRQQLATAESMMFNVADEVFVENRFARGLWYGEPEMLKTWEAIGQYNRFFAENKGYYAGARSTAPLAIVLDNRSEGIEVLNALAGRNVLYNVLYEHELTPQRLQPFAVVVLLSAEAVRSQALAALQQYVQSGGRLFVAPKTATFDELGQRRDPPAWMRETSGQGRMVCWPKLPEVDELARQLRAALPAPPVCLRAPPSVLYNVTVQPPSGRRMVHVLNYSAQPAQQVVVSVDGHYDHATVLTPEGLGASPPVVRIVENRTEITMARLQIYALLVVQ